MPAEVWSLLEVVLASAIRRAAVRTEESAVALYNSVRPPTSWPWLYDQTVALAFLHVLKLIPSPTVPSELTTPVPSNRVQSAFAC